MSKEAIFHLRMDSDLRQEVEEQALNHGITSAEWIREAIEFYLENGDGNDIPSIEEIQDMDWDELEELNEDFDLGIDIREYDHSGFLSSPDEDDTNDLREAIIIELGFSDDSDDSEDLEELGETG